MPSDGALLGPSTASDGTRRAFGDHAWLQAMLDVEAALAHAAADLGVVTRDQAAAVEAACRADQFDLVDLGRRAAVAGNPVIPLVADLRAATPAWARAAVHPGATSQDVIDTSLMLLAARARAGVLTDLGRAADTAAELARRHRHHLAAGRTLGQHAVPITFGLTAATWLVALVDAWALAARLGDRLAVQLGGAAGTLAPLGEAGPEVADRLADRLGLASAPLAWHTTRARPAELLSTLAVVAGALGKVATDVVVLGQTEVGEVRERGGPGRGGSSSMPHKHNPAAATLVIAAAHQVAGLAGTVLGTQLQAGQRAAGPWHAEWEPVRSALVLALGAAERTADLLEGLEIDAARMRSNLAITDGMVMSEAVVTALIERSVEAGQARAAVERAVGVAAAEGRSLADALPTDPLVSVTLDAAALADALDPARHLGATDRFIDRALAHDRTTRGVP